MSAIPPKADIIAGMYPSADTDGLHSPAFTPADCVLQPVITPKKLSGNNKRWRPKDAQFASLGRLIFKTALTLFSAG